MNFVYKSLGDNALLAVTMMCSTALRILHQSAVITNILHSCVLTSAPQGSANAEVAPW